MPLPDTISGKLAAGKIGGNTIAGCYRWEFEEQSDELDGTTAEDLGYANPFAGVIGATVRISGYFNVADGEYEPVRSGTSVTNLYLYDDVVNGSYTVLLPTAVVFRSTKTAEVRGRVEFTAEIKSKGSYTVTDP